MTVENIKKAIKNLTDEDFNGNNGEDYYTSIKINNDEVSMSELDAEWLSVTAGKSDDEIINNACSIIERIVSSNYEEETYYEDFLSKQ